MNQHEEGGIHCRMSDRGWIHALRESELPLKLNRLWKQKDRN